MKKKGILLPIMIIMQLLTGCWSRVEVNDIAIVTATAIDHVEDGKLRLALQIAIPIALAPAGGGGGGGGGKDTTVLVSEVGETVMDAYQRVQVKLSRRITFAHSRILIIGEKAARSGVSSILDFFSRHRESRLGKFILFTKGDAIDLLKIKTNLERYSSEIIREELNETIGLRINLKDFSEMLLSDGVEPIAAEVEIKPEEVKKKEGSESEESASKEKITAAITGLAAFRNDKLAGWMNDKEARGVLWLRNELETGAITVDIPKKKGGGRISAQVLKAKTEIKPTLKDNKVKIEVDVRTENDIYENTSKLDLTDPKVIQYVQKLMEEDIKERIQLALDAAQKRIKSDILGFGTAVHQTYPKEWKQLKQRWDEEFPKLEVNITPNVTVIRIGLTTKSLFISVGSLQERPKNSIPTGTPIGAVSLGLEKPAGTVIAGKDMGKIY